MTQLSYDMLLALFGVVITSEQDRVSRARRLREFAGASSAAGDIEACNAALAEGLSLLELAAAAPGADREVVMDGAFRLGRQAKSVNDPVLAREAFMVATKMLDPTEDCVELGVVWHEIGDTWRAEDDGVQALASYRTAAEHKAESTNLELRLATSSALAAAEHRWGDATACDAVLAEALELFDLAVVTTDADRRTVAALAHHLGGTAESLDRQGSARKAYMIAAEMLGSNADHPELGVVWHDIGDTWRAEGDGAKAVASYRTAAEYRTKSDSLELQYEMLAALADAEHRWGKAAACDAVLAEGVSLLQAAVTPDADHSAIAALASQLGELAESLGRPGPAREAHRLSGQLPGAPPTRLLPEGDRQ